VKYHVDVIDTAKSEIYRHKMAGAMAAYKKIGGLLLELAEHPETGTGHPKPLGGDRSGQWSRKITSAHRLVYVIDNENSIVKVISAFGHYDDK
jgi:toxin YoeB